MRKGVLQSLLDAPRWLFLLTLVYAPWAYGCTVPWAIDVLGTLLGLTLGAWLVGCLARGGLPRLHPVALWGVVLFLCLGWGMALNAHSALLAIAPGTMDGAVSVAMMWRVSGILGVLLFVSDFSRRPEWRRRLWWTIGIVGVSIVFLGLLQRASGIPFMFPHENQTRRPFFGTFGYHGNAGAFIILVFPAIAGLLLVSARKAVDDLGRLIWVPAVLICMVGAAVCFSRAALAITVLLAGAFGIWALRHLPRRMTPWQMALYGLVALVAVVGVTSTIGWAPMLEKWRLLGHQLTGENPRLIAATAAWPMVEDAGIFGLGPGTFRLLFPRYSAPFPTLLHDKWPHLHQDYMQTVIEWGWVGAAIGAVLFVGGLVAGLRGLRENRLGTDDRTLIFASLAALVGIALHAMVDYPLQIASLQLYAATYLGMAWASPWWETRSGSG